MMRVFVNAKIYVEKGDYAQAVLVKDGVIECI